MGWGRTGTVEDDCVRGRHFQRIVGEPEPRKETRFKLKVGGEGRYPQSKLRDPEPQTEDYDGNFSDTV